MYVRGSLCILEVEVMGVHVNFNNLDPSREYKLRLNLRSGEI